MPNRFDPSLKRRQSAMTQDDLFFVNADGALSTLDKAVDFAPRRQRRHTRPGHGWAALTPAEVAVARQIANGHTNAQAAEMLFIAPSTVKTHLERTYAKLAIHGRAALATQVARNDIGLSTTSELH